MSDRTISLKMIAAECGVSAAAVSLALSGIPGRLRADTRQRILACADRLHYSCNPAARTLRRCKTDIFTLVLPPFMSSIPHIPDFNSHVRQMQWEMIFEVISAAAAAGYDVKIEPVRHDTPVETLLPRLDSRRTDGCIFFSGAYFSSIFPRLAIPAVSANFTSRERRDSDVTVDVSTGFREAARELAGVRGMRRFAFVGELKSDPLKNDIRQCVRLALAECPETEPAEFHVENLFDVISLAGSGRLDGFDAVFCANDAVADLTLRGFAYGGKSKHPCLIGFDDNPVWHEFSTIGYDRKGFSDSAVDLLLRKIRGEACDPVVVPCRFIRRNEQ